MADTRGEPSTPLTPEQANTYEKPIRREMYIGLAVGLAILIILIVTIMEVRFRSALGEPRPSATLDVAMQQVMDPLYPLPARIASVRLTTNQEAEVPSYEVVLEDPDGRLLYDMARQARTVYLLDSGPRAGDPINLDVELQLQDDGTVDGLYRQDRAVPVLHYRQVVENLLREAMVAFHSHASYPPVFEPSDDDEQATARMRQEWDAVTD